MAKDTFTRREVAALLASQTAMIAVLFEEVLASGGGDRTRLVNRLYELSVLADSDPEYTSGPINHLISIVENGPWKPTLGSET